MNFEPVDFEKNSRINVVLTFENFHGKYNQQILIQQIIGDSNFDKIINKFKFSDQINSNKK